MQVSERTPGDLARLEEMIAAEPLAKPRDRYRMVLLALRGYEKSMIAHLLGVAKSTVEGWVYRYRDSGLECLRGKPLRGSQPKIRGANAEKLLTRLRDGPGAKDAVCTLRAIDLQRIAREELGVQVSLNSVYRLLHKNGFSCMKPRPRHEKQDLAAQKKFKEESAPLLSAP